jgi:hypothetical protein
VVNGRFDVTLVNPTVTLTGFNVDADGVPGAVLDLLDLDQEIADTLAWAVERFMAPMVNKALAGVAVPDPSVDLIGQRMLINIEPAGVAFDATGAEVVLDAAMTVEGALTSRPATAPASRSRSPTTCSTRRWPASGRAAR